MSKKRLTLIGILLGNEKQEPEEGNYFIFVDDSYNIVNLNREKLIHLLQREDIEFRNIGLEGNRLVGTNGSLDRYNRYCGTNKPLNSPIKYVILNRFEKEDTGEVIGYTVIDAYGAARKLKLDDAIKIGNKYGFSNGKVVELNGKTVVSAIKGHYPLCKLDFNSNNKQSTENEYIDINIALFGAYLVNDKVACEYASVMLDFKNAEQKATVLPIIAKSNQYLINKLTENSEYSEEDFEVYKLYGNSSSLFGIIDLRTLLEVIKMRGKGNISYEIGKEDNKRVFISCINELEGEKYEACVELNSDLKVKNTDIENREAALFCKEFISKKVLPILSKLK